MAINSVLVRVPQNAVVNGISIPADTYQAEEIIRPSINHEGGMLATYSIDVMVPDKGDAFASAAVRSIDITDQVKDGSFVLE